MTLEEVMVRLGLDAHNLNEGLNEAKNKVADWAHDIKGTMVGAFTGFIAADTIFEGFKGALEFAKEIGRVSQATGLSTEEFQKFAYTVEKVGGESEQTEQALVHLSRTIGEAKTGTKEYQEIFDRWGISSSGNTSDVLEEISQKMAAIVDPAQKAAMAADFFGRGAAKMTAALEDWNKLHGDGATFVKDKDLENLEMANELFDKIWNKMKVILAISLSKGWEAASVVLSTGSAGEAGEMGRKKGEEENKHMEEAALQKRNHAKEIDDQDKAERLRKQKDFRDRQAKLNAQDDADKDERLKKHAEFQKKQAEFFEKEAKESFREWEKHERETKDLKLATMRREALDLHHAAVIGAPYFHTLQELAESAHWVAGRPGTNWFGGMMGSPAALQANIILQARERLRNYTLQYGFNDAAKTEAERIKSLKAPLEAAGFITPEDQLAKVDEKLAQMVERMAGKDGGVIMQAKNG